MSRKALTAQSTNYPITLGDRGRLVLPAPLRERLQLRPGDSFVASVDADGSLRLVSLRTIAQDGLGLLSDVVPAGVSLVDELINERRAEAAADSGS